MLIKVAKDPMCGMNVDEKTAPSSSYSGKTYYFCCGHCKAQFEKDPSKYVR
jgi:YHS domain-containing protein